MRPRRGAHSVLTDPSQAAPDLVVTNPAGALEAILSDLVARVEGASGATLADRNGLTVASASPMRAGLEIASAMATLIATAAHRVLDGFGPDRFQCAILEGSHVRILVCEVSEGVASLILVTSFDTNLGLARLELQRAAMELTTALDLDFL